MKTAWDYTQLADAYLSRPDYSESALDELVQLAGVSKGDRVCDVGAGVAHLTLALARRGLSVIAVEPNQAMRENGIRRTAGIPEIHWAEGVGEATGQDAQSFRFVTFGSSFNVCDRPAALRESARILEAKGWFACMWNHRDLEDPTQRRIEDYIQSRVPAYAYGTRREDQTEVIEASGLFESVHRIEGVTYAEQSTEECVKAWRSHATLERQAGSDFASVVDGIEGLLQGERRLRIPYTTRIWAARLR